MDRVRLRDPENQLVQPDSLPGLGGPGRGSGWRQRSLSSIDLTFNNKKRHQEVNPREQYTGLYDLYTRIEARKESIAKGIF